MRSLTARLTAMFMCAPALMVMVMNTDAEGAPTVARYGVYEISLTSSRSYDNPPADTEVRLEFTAPSGLRSEVRAFWDGGATWKARFSPDETGQWRWVSRCDDKSNAGFHNQRGTLECSRYRGSNALQKRGPLKLSSNRRYLEHLDGTPFLWLADTAWNGVLKANEKDWEEYLKVRRSQGFTAVQFVCTNWRAHPQERAFTGEKDIRIDPEFFRRLDSKVAAINRNGLVAAPVVLWAFRQGDPGFDLPEKDAILLAKYIVARWGAYNVVWLLGGDGKYGGTAAPRWRTIGREAFGNRPARLATLHPGGAQWVGEDFRSERWFSFVGYQSGHGQSEQVVKWLVQGPPATEWDNEPILPVINLEPNYEAIGYRSAPVDAPAVRNALYRSLLISPTAGVTYGHHGTWFWPEKPEVPTAHENTGIAVPWHEAVKSPGAESVKHLAKLFGALRWWTLRPDPELVQNRPSEPMRFIASSRSEDGTLALAHLPEPGEVTVDARRLKRPAEAKWYEAATGKYTPAGRIDVESVTLRTPGDGDWVLVIGD